MATDEKQKSRPSLSYLQRVLDVVELYQEHKQPGVMDKWIYNTYIYPRFRIHYNTFLRYLSIPAAKEMREALEEIEAENGE
jgi:hypothetical protein